MREKLIFVSEVLPQEKEHLRCKLTFRNLDLKSLTYFLKNEVKSTYYARIQVL